MADPLKIGIEVDTSQLGKLASASQEVAASANTMSGAFSSSTDAAANLAQKLMAGGLSAKETEGALHNLGLSAKETAAAMSSLSSATAVLGSTTAATSTQLDGMTRQLANSAVRIAASEAGLGQLGFALGRVGAMSETLAPILASTFGIFAAVALAQIVDELYDKLRSMAMQTELNAEAWVKINQSSDVTLNNMDTQLDRLDEKLAGLTEGKMAQLELSMKHISDGSVEMASKMESLFDAIGKQLDKEEPLLEKVKDFYVFISTYDLVLPTQGELAKGFGASLTQTLDLQGTAAGLNLVNEQIQKVNAELGKDQGNKQLREYSDQLEKVQEQLWERLQVEQKEKDVAAAGANKENAEILSGIYESGVEWAQKGADVELGLIDKLKSAGLPISLLATENVQMAGGKEAIESMIEMQKRAEEELAKLQKANAEEEKKNAREAEEAWQHAAEARIRSEEEAFRVSQKTAEDQMRDIKAQQSLSTAGIGRGPLTTVIESTSLEQQGAIAAQAMQQAQVAAAGYQSQLDIVKDAMADVNQKTEEGAREFKDLEKQMEQLQRLMDNANASSEKWATTLKQVAGQLSQQGFSWANLEKGIEGAANAGFNSFNSAFTKMLAGGISFTRLMQTAWTAMVNSFVTSILKLAEEWVVKHVIMAAIDKIFGAQTVATNAASVAAKITQNKALALSEVGVAGAGGVASMAAAPFPIDLTAPAFGAAMAAAAAGFAVAEQGGIVPIATHAGEMILPRNISAFVQHSAASFGTAPGGTGGAGGAGGPGGSGGPAGHTFQFNNYGSGAPADVKASSREFMKSAMKELRRMNRV